jgi:hypothetical protein
MGGKSRARANTSVLSQIGPTTSTAVHGAAAGGSATGRIG